MLNKVTVYFFHSLLILLPYSCQVAGSRTGEQTETTGRLNDSVMTVTEPVDTLTPYDKKLSDASLVLAGLNPEDAALKNRVTHNSAWNNYSAWMSEKWDEITINRLSSMVAWADSERVTTEGTGSTLFYPFSGPDFLNAITLFPDADNYVLIALERLGKMPDFSAMDESSFDNYLQSVQVSLIDLFRRSYFVTKNMSKDLVQDRVDGTLPLIALFMARTGNYIAGVTRISVDTNGKVTNCSDENESGFNKRNARGLDIGFVTRGKNNLRHLYYFRADLSDEGLKRAPEFMKYLNGLGTTTGYLKSASYLLHYREFSRIRNLMLQQCAFILQDDSGIAFHYFSKEEWNFRFYGTYTTPIKDFRGLFQHDLAGEYKKESAVVEPVPFNLGYHWGSNGINLMCAKKKTLTESYHR
ncbi:MAG: hypothetical protein HYY40_09140 [Bacteroidetes bacterium]|nr:hypothetical protein [Bacteroidota bacterium]